MSFSSDTLSFKAYAYNNRNDTIKLTTKHIKLHKQADGSYGVGPNQILVKVHSAAFNPVDLILKNMSGFPFTFSGNFGIGKDFSGTIAAIGAQAAAKTHYEVGTSLSGLVHGTWSKGAAMAEYVIFEAGGREVEYTVAPKNVTLNEAAAFPLVLGTALLMIGDADVRDKKVLVLGSSTSVGRYVVQLAKLGGAKEIVVTCSGKSSGLAKDLGATSVIDYTQHKSLLNPVLESVKYSGKFDFVMDCAGNGDLFAQINNIVAKGATYNSIVGDRKLSYTSLVNLPTIWAQTKAMARVIGSSLGLLSYHYGYFMMVPGKNWFDKAGKLIEQGDLKIHIDSVYQLNEFEKAVAKLESNRSDGKLILQVSQD